MSRPNKISDLCLLDDIPALPRLLVAWLPSQSLIIEGVTNGIPVGVGAIGDSITREFSRPNDANPYVAGDVVSNSTGATTMAELTNIARTNGGSGYIVKARLTTDKKSITPRFRVHLFSLNTATVAADNAQWKELYADADKRVGYFDLPAMITAADAANSDMSRSIDFYLRMFFKCEAASRNLYYVLEALDGFTPSNNEKFRLTLAVEQN